MADPNPTLSPQRQPEDTDAALRPKNPAEFVGQVAARENLRVLIEAARGRGEAMDHVLSLGLQFVAVGSGKFGLDALFGGGRRTG